MSNSEVLDFMYIPCTKSMFHISEQTPHKILDVGCGFCFFLKFQLKFPIFNLVRSVHMSSSPVYILEKLTSAQSNLSKSCFSYYGQQLKVINLHFVYLMTNVFLSFLSRLFKMLLCSFSETSVFANS